MNRLRAAGGEPDVRRFLSLLWRDGAVREIRVPKYNQYGQTASGYFDSVESAAVAAEKWDAKANIYITLNPVNPALLARAVNRVEPRALNTTADEDIVEREWLFIDIDAQRASGISSTEAELAAAQDLLADLTAFLAAAGWPEPVTCMSGNGCYALFRIELPNDAEATALVKQVLEALSERFDTEAAHVDTGVFNAARIVALIGTLKKKGDSTEDRPHRRSYVMSVPEHLDVVSRAQLEAVCAEQAPGAPNAGPFSRTRRSSSLTDMLDAAGIEYREQPADANGVTWYHVRQCPLHDDGKPFECGVGQTLPDGPYAGHCFHPEGAGKGWHHFKRALGLDAGVAPDSHDPVMVGRAKARGRIVTTGRFRRDIAGDTWEALLASPDTPRLFRHGGGIAEVVRDDETGRSVISHLVLATIAGYADRAADFIRITEQGERPARPPDDVIRDMEAMRKPLPVLRGVVGTPVFAADGTLCTEPGYQPATALFYDPIGDAVPPVPDIPDETDLRRAKTLLAFDWLGDFPFTDESSRTHAVAVPLTAIVRELIDGPTPLNAIDAPTAGTGKGLLASGIAIVATGRAAAVMPEVRSEDELRKRLTAKFCEGHALLLIDNIRNRLDSGVLAAALTSTVWSDRILGRSATADLPVRNLWLVTGNNLQFSEEISRRTVAIRLDARRDRPWLRDGFRHANLDDWVRRHRHELIWALLVLVKHWMAVGRPLWNGTPLGSFESWARIVGGILGAAGFAGFLDNREDVYSRADSASEEWRRFVAAWWSEFEARPVVVGQLLPFARDLLPSAFEKAKDDASERALNTRLGKALATQRDRWFGDLAIRQAGIDAHTKAAAWALEPADVGRPEAPSSAQHPQGNEPVSGSFADVADVADMDSGSSGNCLFPEPEKETSPESVNRHPHLPQHPQTDSDPGDPAADDVRMMPTPAADVPRCKRCPRVPEKPSSHLCDECIQSALREVMKGQV